MAKMPQRLPTSKKDLTDQALASTRAVGVWAIALGVLAIVAPDPLLRQLGTIKGSFAAALAYWLILDVIPGAIVIFLAFKLRRTTAKTLAAGQAISKQLIIVMVVQCILWVLSGIGIFTFPYFFVILFVRRAWFRLGQAAQSK